MYTAKFEVEFADAYVYCISSTWLFEFFKYVSVGGGERRFCSTFGKRTEVYSIVFIYSFIVFCFENLGLGSFSWKIFEIINQKVDVNFAEGPIRKKNGKKSVI